MRAPDLGCVALSSQAAVRRRCLLARAPCRGAHGPSTHDHDHVSTRTHAGAGAHPAPPRSPKALRGAHTSPAAPAQDGSCPRTHRPQDATAPIDPPGLCPMCTSPHACHQQRPLTSRLFGDSGLCPCLAALLCRPVVLLAVRSRGIAVAAIVIVAAALLLLVTEVFALHGNAHPVSATWGTHAWPAPTM